MRAVRMNPPTHQTLRQIYSLDKSPSTFPEQLSSALHRQEYYRCVENIDADDLAWLVDYLDKALDVLEPSGLAFRRCLNELRSTCGTKATLPASYVLSSDHLSVHPEPFASGEHSDVHEGTLGGSRICAKRTRVYQDDKITRRISKTFHQEAVIWKHMVHLNILPLRGVTITSTCLGLISNLMSGGTLPEYIRERPDEDRVKLLSDVARGLRYIHSCNVVHGSIKGSNVLVDGSGRAVIADFSLATVSKAEDSAESESEEIALPMRWTAPEVLEGGAFCKQADVFSFAMLMVEVFANSAPFGGGHSDIMAMVSITKGRRPFRPEHSAVTNRLWEFIQRCWNHDPCLRPEAAEVLKELLVCNSPTWKLLFAHTPVDERIPPIISILSDRDEAEALKYLSGDEAQTFVDTIDEAFKVGTLGGLPKHVRMRCLRTSYGICGRRALLPKARQIPLCYDPMETPHFSGGFADVWKGHHLGKEVAAKVLRVYLTGDLERARKGFCREVMIWSTLRHPNVLPLLGVTVSENRFVMISEWMDNGNVNEFLEKNPDVDRLELLRDIANGLVYMHDQGVAHGDLKGANIMVDDSGRARIADFSLIALILDRSTLQSSSFVGGGTLRWMSPELLDPQNLNLNDRRPTRKSDCYALGMVAYEILSGQEPFKEFSCFIALTKVVEGERPEKPQGEGGKWFTDEIWAVMERCWRHNPDHRASAKDVLRCLKETPSPSRPSSPLNTGVGDGTGVDSGGQSDASSDSWDTDRGEN